jgi:hypothetical protein
MARDVTSIHTNNDAVLYTGQIRMLGFLYTSSGGNLDHIKLYDGLTATGPAKLELDTTKQGVVAFGIPEGGMIFSTGIYCDIGGATSVTILVRD